MCLTHVSFKVKIKAAYASSGLPVLRIFMTIRRLSFIRQFGGWRGSEGDDISAPAIMTWWSSDWEPVTPPCTNHTIRPPSSSKQVKTDENFVVCLPWLLGIMKGLHKPTPVRLGVSHWLDDLFSNVHHHVTFLQALGVEWKVTSNVSTDLMSDINKESLHSVLTLQIAMAKGGRSVTGYHGALHLWGSEAVLDRRVRHQLSYEVKQAKHMQLTGMPGGQEGGTGSDSRLPSILTETQWWLCHIKRSKQPKPTWIRNKTRTKKRPDYKGQWHQAQTFWNIL